MFKSIRNPLYNNQIFLSDLSEFSTDENGNTNNKNGINNNNSNLNFSNSRFIRKNNSTSSSSPQVNPQVTPQIEDDVQFLPHPDPELQYDRSIVIKSSATEVDSLDGLGIYKKDPLTKEWVYHRVKNIPANTYNYTYTKRTIYSNDIQTYKETKCTVINRAPSYTNIYDPLYIYNSIDEDTNTSITSKSSKNFVKYGQIIEDF
jgi:hypothetical protein